jgi:hypothetical protein
MALGTTTANELKNSAAETQKAHTRLLQELHQHAKNNTLPADKLIDRIFKAASTVDDPQAFQNASRRKSLGNPPGKGSSLGDGINWEILLACAPHGEDLCLVSADGDFASPLDAAVMDEYLVGEWTTQKQSDVEYYRDIKQFLDDKYPLIRLVSDVRKYFLIDSLIESESFAQSHAVAAELNRYDSFTQEEALRLLSGGMENNQVRWLACDEDVVRLLRKVLNPHRSVLPKFLVDQWDYVMAGRGNAYGPPPTEYEFMQPTDESVDDSRP